MEEIKNSHENVAKIYNDRLARDAILELEHVELNDNKVKKKAERESLQKELDAYLEAERVNEELRIDHMSFEERERENAVEENITAEIEMIKFQERQLLKKALSKYGDAEEMIGANKDENADEYHKRQGWMAQAFYIYEKEEDRQVRDCRLRGVKDREEKETKLDQRFLKQEQIKDYNIELMFQNHREFKHLTDGIRNIHDRIRLQCKESTNAFAFRIHCILDVAKVKCPSEDMRTIIRRHKKYWPYKSLTYDRGDKDATLGNRGTGEDADL